MPQTLPLTPFEELMLYQDSRAYPCTCFIRLRFEGQLKKKPFEAAARNVLERHPLLGARLDQSSGRPAWELEADPAVHVHWREGDVGDDYSPTEYLDLAAGGLRLWVTCDDAASELLVQFHHVCCDGLGIFQYIHDLLVLYAQESGESLPEKALPEVDPARLVHRNRFGLTAGKLLKMVPQQAKGFAGVRQFLMRSPVPTVPHDRVAGDEPTSQPYPAACGLVIDAETVSALRTVSRQHKVTTNDLLARDLFCALHAFRSLRGVATDDAWLRMMIPMSMRSAADRRTSAANIVSSIFLDRQGAQIEDPARLLASIRDEMQLIKDNRLGLTFNFSLHFNRWTPGGVRKLARGEHCNTSAVFTNLGKLFSRTALPREERELVAGDVRLVDVGVLAPLTPYTCTAFSAAWYANRLHLALHYDPRVLESTDARDLLDRFGNEIRRTAGCQAPAVLE